MAVWTREQAREMAAKGNYIRWHAPKSPAEPPETPPRIAQDDYAVVVLTRTRKQLDLVAQRILDELEKDKPDSRRLRDLSDAQRHLAEQERILAGRPLPGSRRPKDHDNNPSPPTAQIDYDIPQPAPPPIQGISLPGPTVPTPPTPRPRTDGAPFVLPPPSSDPGGFGKGSPASARAGFSEAAAPDFPQGGARPESEGSSSTGESGAPLGKAGGSKYGGRLPGVHDGV